MKRVNPYLNFNGNTEEAFNFYKSVFGGDFSVIMRFGDTPEAEKVPEADKNKVMHIALPLNNGQILMGTDACESMGFKLIVGNNISISIVTESEDELRNIFEKLAVGGKIDVQLDKMFWGELFGQVTDKYGVRWMIAYRDTIESF